MKNPHRRTLLGTPGVFAWIEQKPGRLWGVDTIEEQYVLDLDSSG